jgi:antitoxin CptB
MSADASDSTETLRRRLRWRSHHRGTKELDILFGRFADAHLGAMTREELLVYESLLEVEDPLMLGWMMGTTAPPAEARSHVLDALLAFTQVWPRP